MSKNQRIARAAKGKRPQYFHDPATDRLLAIVMTLAGELSVCRERLDAIERLLDDNGVLERQSVDNYVPDAEATVRAQSETQRIHLARHARRRDGDRRDSVREKKPVISSKSSIHCFKNFAVCLLAALAACADEPGYDLAIRNVTVIDAVDGARTDRTVLIRGDRIERVTAGAGTDAAATNIDGRGLFLIPALWDMHVHLTFDPDIAPAMPGLLLAHGVAYVRDNGGALDAVLAARSSAAENPMSAPDVYVSGPLLDGERVVYDGSASWLPGDWRCRRQRRGRHRHRRRAGDAWRGSDQGLRNARPGNLSGHRGCGAPARPAGHFAHSVVGRRVSTRPNPGSTPSSTCATSNSRARPSTPHCSGSAAQYSPTARQRRAGYCAAGFTIFSAIKRVASNDRGRCTRLIRRFVANDVAQNPTYALISMVMREEWTDAEWRQTFDDLPDRVRTSWLELAGRMADVFDGSAQARADRERYFHWARAWIAEFHAAGGTLFAGTDTPIFFMTPGASLHRELELLVEAGLTPRAALAAATTAPARYFGLTETQGTRRGGTTRRPRSAQRRSACRHPQQHAR